MSPPSHSVRRVASADPKQRPIPEPRPATSSTTTCSSFQPQASEAADALVGGLANFNETGDSVSVIPDAVQVEDCSIGPNGDEDREVEIGILETASDDPELLAPDVEQEPVGENGLTSSPETYETADADDAYAAEQLAQDDGGYQWGDSSAYDPTLWSAEENGDTYAEDVGWTYGALDDGANEDEDSSRQYREDSHISTNSSYAIDLHLSSRTSTAGQPDGAVT